MNGNPNKCILLILLDSNNNKTTKFYELVVTFRLSSKPHLERNEYNTDYWSSLKVQLSKYNDKFMIASTQETNTEIFAFIAVPVFNLLSRKVLFTSRKVNRNC